MTKPIKPTDKHSNRKQDGETTADAKALPPGGPHAKPHLTDVEKTPGSGMFPKPGTKKTDAPAG